MQFKDFVRGELKFFRKTLLSITQKLDEMSKKDDQLLAFAERLNASTNEIAKDLKSALDDIKNNAVSDSTIAILEKSIAANEALGADPVNPVPEVPAEPTPPAPPAEPAPETPAPVEPPVEVPAEPTETEAPEEGEPA